MPHIKALSKSAYWDDRNESAVALVKAIMERTKDEAHICELCNVCSFEVL